ncbi:MAG: glycosyltransferase family 1 protein, partial [Rhodospirillaceae bacterium]|nr:glycosyltransferase family 1 protein [Rhodospirillaceae bacterium]
MDILLLDDSFAYDGYTPRHDPMGGPEKGLVYLADTLARCGHGVTVRNQCTQEVTLRGVNWRSLENAGQDRADLVIALRQP